MVETKTDKFVRIAEARTNKIIGMIKLLGNCANKQTYEYTREDIKKIFAAIEDELKVAKARFETSENDDKEFKLR